MLNLEPAIIRKGLKRGCLAASRFFFLSNQHLIDTSISANVCLFFLYWCFITFCHYPHFQLVCKTRVQNQPSNLDMVSLRSFTNWLWQVQTMLKDHQVIAVNFFVSSKLKAYYNIYCRNNLNDCLAYAWDIQRCHGVISHETHKYVPILPISWRSILYGYQILWARAFTAKCDMDTICSVDLMESCSNLSRWDLHFGPIWKFMTIILINMWHLEEFEL